MVFVPQLEMIPVLNSQHPSKGAVDAVENLLLSLVDGNTTIEQLGDSCGLEKEIAQRIIAKLYNAGVVQIKGIDGARGSDNGSAPQQMVSSTQVGGSNPASEGESKVEKIEQLHQKIEQSNYYMVLGVSPLATRGEIRAAYFALSKKYHPDKQSRNIDAQLKKKLSRIFDTITTAYDVLSGKSRREKYDATISGEIEMWKMENQLRQAVDQRPSRASEQKGSVEKPKVTSQQAPASVTSRTVRRSQSVNNDRIASRRTPVQDRVSVGIGARISRVPVTRSSYAKAQETAVSKEEERRASAISRKNSNSVSSASKGSLSPEDRELRRQQWKRDRIQKAFGESSSVAGGRSSASPTTSSSTGRQSDDYLLEHARIALEHHEFDLSVQYLQELLRRDGENSAASMLLHRAQSGKVKANVNDLIRQGRFEQSKGKLHSALELYERALKLDDRYIEAKHHVASALLDARKDLSRALKLSREVVGMGGNKASYFATLAELFDLSNEPARAVDAMERAAGLAPDNRDYKKRLKTLKK